MNPEIMQEMHRAFGKKFSAEKEALLAYNSDASQVRGTALAVVWPESRGDVQGIVEFALKHKIDIVARGAATRLAGAAVPQNSIVVDLSRMNKIIEINKREKYAIVEPGIVAAQLNLALQKYNLCLPVEPASHSVCSIAGMIATNASGLRAMRFGRMEEWVMEAQIVDGSGKMRKTNAEEICGTEGTVGIIVGAKLRLHEAVIEKSADLEKFDSLHKMLERADALKKNASILSLEVMNPIAAKTMGLDSCYYLLAEYDNESGALKSGEMKKAKSLRIGLWPKLASAGFSVIEDPQVAEEKITGFAEFINASGLPFFAHIADGTFHVLLKPEQKGTLEALYGKVRALNGNVSGEHGIGITKREFADARIKNRIKRLKEKLDPKGIFNRGKII